MSEINVNTVVLKTINNSKQDVFDENFEHFQLVSDKYNKFAINRCLFRFKDTILSVNTVNQYNLISDEMHFDFLNALVRKGYRFSSKVKNESNVVIEYFMEKYNCSWKTACEYYNVLNDKQKQKLLKVENERRSV